MLRRDGAQSACVECCGRGWERDGGEEAPCYAFVVTDVRRRFDVDFKEAKTGYSTSESCLAGSSKNRAAGHVTAATAPINRAHHHCHAGALRAQDATPLPASPPASCCCASAAAGSRESSWAGRMRRPLIGT